MSLDKTLGLLCLYFQVVIGGFNTNLVEMLNLDTIIWKTLDPLPIPSLHNHSCCIIKEEGDETIYVAGGEEWTSAQYGGFCKSSIQNKVWKMRKGTWSLAGELVEARCMHSMGVLDGYGLVVVGGKDENGRPLFSMEKMCSAGHWKTLRGGSLSVGRYGHAMAAVPKEFYPRYFYNKDWDF